MVSTLLATDVELMIESLGQLPEPVASPALVVVCGLPGTGKSYFCSKLACRLPFAILESDALRKVLYSPPGYSPKESSRLFQAIQRLSEKLLKKGIPLILDATNLSERYREYLYSIADRQDVRLVLVRVEAPAEVVRKRLAARLDNPDGNSDADWATYQKMKSSVEKIRRKHYAVDTSLDITPVLNKIVKEVNN